MRPLALALAFATAISMAIPAMPGPVMTAGAAEAIGTGFNVTRHGYNFSNYAGAVSSGNCFGVAMTSILYYEGMKSLPGSAPFAYELEPEEGKRAIAEYHEAQGEVWDDQGLSLQVTFSLMAKYAMLKRNLSRDDPVIVAIWKEAGTGAMVGHALVAYRLVETDDNRSLVYVYDPNYPYDGTGSYIQWVTIDRGNWTFTYTGEIGTWIYDEYAGMVIVTPQLSHNEAFWRAYWWLPWAGAAAFVCAGIFIALILIRRHRQGLYRAEVAREKIDCDEKAPSTGAAECHSLDEIDSGKAKSIASEYMTECPSCGTMNPRTESQCRMCAAPLNRE